MSDREDCWLTRLEAPLLQLCYRKLNSACVWIAYCDRKKGDMNYRRNISAAVNKWRLHAQLVKCMQQIRDNSFHTKRMTIYKPLCWILPTVEKHEKSSSHHYFILLHVGLQNEIKQCLQNYTHSPIPGPLWKDLSYFNCILFTSVECMTHR